ncbi:hypothetical protein M153_2500051080 [Pseudoloma neurophilia]|uniref:Uncharacterized protein n=1 Tax=Pseudoloma neurophilia TaxID=146866 RepID=A0A0R0M153_9MICR|nr:hypothetical protein M153_2500051080 [Pseudoloma neurophilia]
MQKQLLFKINNHYKSYFRLFYKEKKTIFKILKKNLMFLAGLLRNNKLFYYLIKQSKKDCLCSFSYPKEKEEKFCQFISKTTFILEFFLWKCLFSIFIEKMKNL